jgi:DNA-binding transcriptional ArsR family regulator
MQATETQRSKGGSGMANPYGDIELTPKGMRALAHPVRLAILSQLQRHGPSTATALSPVVGATPSVTSWHLRHLAEHGLVRDADVHGDGRQRWWEAAARGFRFAPPPDGEDDDAYRMLSRTLLADSERMPRQWAREIEPWLDGDWLAASGLANTRILATAAELRAIEDAIEDLLAPYVRRKDDPDSAPEGARRVRIMRYVLPGLDADGGLW